MLGAAIIGVVRGKWFALSASVTLLALVAIAVTMLSLVSPKRTKPAVLMTQVPPPVELHLSGKIRAQSIVSVAPPVEGTVGALFVDVGQEVFEGQLLARITNEGLETGQQMAQKILDNAQSRVSTLESEIVTARLEASRARADANRARTEYDRLNQVFRHQQLLLAEGATPRLMYEKSSAMSGVAKELDETDPRRAILLDATAAQITAASELMFNSGYGGTHWLASFAIYYYSAVGLQ